MVTSTSRLLLEVILVLSISSLCVYGNCQQPLSGSNCKRRNIVHNFQNLPTEKDVLGFRSYFIGTSGTHFWPARAFDGDFNTAFITKVEQNPYLWVNLKSIYTLHTMTIYTDANRPSDFKIEVDYSSDFESARLCYQDQISQGRRVHLINCTQPIEGQYVRIQIPTTPNYPRSLTVYELEIYQCEDGYYGPDCTPCGQCQNGAKCDNINGECPGGCRLGFAGMRCDECADGYYGYPNCQMCGKCRYGVLCNKISGECPGGCVPGKKPKLCQTDCDDGTYGQGCTGRCGKCANNVPCNKRNGACTSCAPGYSGQLCNECPSGYYSYPNCKACGRCQEGTNCNKITGECPYRCVPGRKPPLCHQECDDHTYGQGCKMTCGKCANNAVCAKVDGTCPAGCSPRFAGQRCGECADGYYGFPNCNTCGLCRDGDHCNKINGECPSGCDLGRTGKLCQAGCDDGFYGQGCTDQCGNCANNTVCNRTDGACPKGCNSRFTGKLCKECKDGFYGENCTACGQCRDQKPCNKINGHCPNGCEKGRKGTLCQECADGFFGVNCSKMCHCLNKTEICNKTTGNCSTCAAGFVGEDCQDCSKNRFGKDCQGICHCADNGTCNPVSGNCHGGCSSGFVGENCQSAKVADQPGTSGGTVGGIAGGVVGLLVLVAIVVGLIVFFKRRAKQDLGANNAGVVEESHFADKMDDANAGEPSVNAYENEGSLYANAAAVIDRGCKIRIERLVDYIAENMAQKFPFGSEFKKLPQELIKATDEAEKEHNIRKCRYRKLVPYKYQNDETRVVLDTINGDETTDFINASYIKGYNGNRAYIASQGTTKFNINDFWRMVWQEQVGKIVMLTNLIEGGKTKVLQYWPDSGTKEFGDISVEIMDRIERTDYCIRALRVKKGVHVRNVQQFQFLGWPDHDVPHDTPGLIDFREKVNSSSSKLNGPIVIHCSAGVGRTGAYITFDYSMDLLEEETELDIFQTVSNLRNQRSSMVQTREQYAFVHRLIRDAYLCRSSVVDRDQLTLRDLKSTTFKLKIQAKFESLCKMCQEAETADNSLNRAGMKRFWFSSGGTNFIDTTSLPTDRENVSMFSTKVPGKHEIVNFWRMVHEFENACLLLLGRDLQSASFLPKGKTPLQIDSVEVSYIRDEKISDFLKISYLSVSLEDISREVPVFCYTGWGKDPMPSASQLVEVKNQISIWERQDTSGTIFTVCRDGLQRSGLYGVSDFIIDSLNTEGKVNVLLAAKRFRGCCPNSLQTLRQYEFCYEAICAYLDSLSTYANMGVEV